MWVTPCHRTPLSKGVTGGDAAMNLAWGGRSLGSSGNTRRSTGDNTKKLFPSHLRTSHRPAPLTLPLQTLAGHSLVAKSGQGCREVCQKGQDFCFWKWWSFAAPGSGRRCFQGPGFGVVSRLDLQKGHAGCGMMGIPNLRMHQQKQ